jgi:16S rRNA (cytosine1402-N4)-methyltransferase
VIPDPEGHVPVLPGPVTDLLTPVFNAAGVDCTVGLGGHARLLLAAAPPAARLLALDIAPENLRRATEGLADFSGRVLFVQANFRDLDAALANAGIDAVDFILADLGVSSNQIASPHLGLSFDIDAPLDMRLDPDLPRTAADLVNRLPEADLANLLYLEAQEGHSRKIAKRICRARVAARISRTSELARLVVQAVGRGRGRIHPATRTFMALRIAVNRETEALDALLASAPDRLRPGGRMAVISFHSGEDRRVKVAFRQRAQSGGFRPLTRRPIVADADELRTNPRSRSAKLRVLERI